MRSPFFVLLPGLDGTGHLLEPFLDSAPAGYNGIIVNYPRDRPLGYDELERLVDERLPKNRDLVLVAESFSGPIAIRLAHRQNVRALVLCNSFVRPPRSPLLRFAAFAPLFRIRLPESVLSYLMLSPKATPELTKLFVDTLREVRPDVVAKRVRELLRVDERETLRAMKKPLLYVRGIADRLVRGKSIAEVVQAAPQTRIAFIPAPHAVLQMAPERSWAEIRAFLEG
jgi:pimeloyl-ACP methyl ester carboxylesterase